MSYDYLIDHALKNVWCTPNQDQQVIVKPARISKPGGEWNTVPVLWNNIPLPLSSTRFHVYQIGQLHPLLMGLFPARATWMTFAEACNQMKLVADLYVQSGLQLPRVESWYMVTRDKNLIIAIKDPVVDTIPVDLDSEDLFLRVYTNAFFNSVRSAPINDFIHVEGKHVLNAQDVATLQANFNQYAALPGHTYAFVNGYKVSNLDLFTFKIGDVAEFVYDSSIKMVYDFLIGDLRTFVSTLDDVRKYFIHYAGLGDGIIEYQDDVDVFLFKTDQQNRHKGIYYHKNQPMALRMVTHKDYAISVDIVDAFTQYQPDWTDVNTLTLRLHIRKSGYDRPLVFEADRIHELYKLNDTDLRGAVLGIDANVENFKGETLEASSYCAIMASTTTCITRALVEDAYGYNAISKLLGDTPKFTRVQSSQKVIDVPYGLQTNATGYEYDVDGKLLDWHLHPSGSIYPVRDVTTNLVEMIAGLTTDLLDETYGEQTSALTPGTSYRFYTCPIVGGIPTNVWTDVTGSGNYAILNNQVTWFTSAATTYTLVRGDSVNLGYRLSLAMPDGLLQFTLAHRALRNGTFLTQLMQIPMGDLDVILNGYSLVEEIDYIVQFPKIVINNKTHLVNPETQNQDVVVRFTGFCNTDLSRTPYTDQGFIDHGLLSNNNRFDIRDDKVLRIVAGGQVFDRSQLLFAETDSGVSAPTVTNGYPYLIRDIVVPLQTFTDGNTYTLRAASEVIDQAVSDYMTLKMPEPSFDTPNVIQALYPIVSPFCNKLMHDLNLGIITDPRLKDHYNDEDVRDICAPYEYLLAFDPTQPNQAVDANYVIIHPHELNTVVPMNIYYYKFLARAVNLYLNNKVLLSHFISIKTN